MAHKLQAFRRRTKIGSEGSIMPLYSPGKLTHNFEYIPLSYRFIGSDRLWANYIFVLFDL
jgi:hypothetical protein